MRNHSILLLAVIVLWIGSAAEAKYSGGTGEPNDPYRIAAPEDLNDIGNHTEDWNKHFILVNDVNLAQYTGRQFRIIGSFSGVFDGNDHKVWNFTWTSTGRDHISLFGYVDTGGHVKNLGLENVDVNALNSNYVSGLVGQNRYGTITNCYSSGIVSGDDDVGGLVGRNHGTITNCYSIGRITGDHRIGGLVGYTWMGTITNCYSTASISGEGGSVAGLVGESDLATITNCYSSGSVLGAGSVGGLVGGNSYTTITNCYSAGNVTGEDAVGGLVGDNMDGGAISNCYSVGDVIGYGWVAGVGGLVGENYHSTITNCYSKGSVSGAINVGGLVGKHIQAEIEDSFWDIQTSDCNTSAGGTGKTTAEMKTMSTFTDAGWDFVEIWGIGENQTYPFLLTDPAGDSNHDKKVDLIDLAILASHWLEEK